MEKQVILLDTSVLIDYYRKKEKSKSYFFTLNKTLPIFAVSSITYFEIYTGASQEQEIVWDAIFEKIKILPVDRDVAIVAAKINIDLKKSRNQIDLPDLFIAATAIANNLPCATLNKKHFSRISNLKLID